jgi:hypothetical protein
MQLPCRRAGPGGAQKPGEVIGEQKKQGSREHWKVYKQDLNKEFVLLKETEEEKKCKKAERLLKKIEEEEQEEVTTSKG